MRRKIFVKFRVLCRLTVCAAAAAQGVRLVLNAAHISALSPLPLTIAVAAACAVYGALLRLCVYEKSTGR